jgi:hypothetical protein
MNQGAPTARSGFLFLIEVMDQCFILSYDPIDKSGSSSKQDKRCREMPSMARFWSSVNCLGTNLAETFDIDISPKCQYWTLAYTHFPSNALQV